jgi:limonene-1,2-epoxide hydrolase
VTGPASTVEEFLTLLEQQQAEAACALLSPDVEWRNTGMPTFRGAKVAGMLRDMERRSIGFRVDLHHVAANGDVVLTERTDHLTYRRVHTSFWVCGTFRVEEGLITLWDDHFSPGNLLLAGVRGVLGAVRA